MIFSVTGPHGALEIDTAPGLYDFMDLNLDKEMIPCITKPTRITNNSAILIDNILISRSLQ